MPHVVRVVFKGEGAYIVHEDKGVGIGELAGHSQVLQREIAEPETCLVAEKIPYIRIEEPCSGQFINEPGGIEMKVFLPAVEVVKVEPVSGLKVHPELQEGGCVSPEDIGPVINISPLQAVLHQGQVVFFPAPGHTALQLAPVAAHFYMGAFAEVIAGRCERVSDKMAAEWF